MTGNPFLSPYYIGQPLKRSQHFTHLMGTAPTSVVCKPGQVEVTAENLDKLVAAKSTDLYKTTMLINNVATLAGMVIGGVHGYRRNNSSIGWAIGWGLLGAVTPFMTTGIAFAQGFTKGSKK